MARINLLPWRAERRKVREREFYMMLATAAAAGIGVFLAGMFWMDARIENQVDRNDYLTAQIKEVDAKIEQIKELDKARSKLLARKQVIEQLQANRSQMVHMFDELVRTIPDGARMVNLKQAGDILTLEGVAQSNASVATYMRNLEASPWLGHPDLKKTEAQKDRGADKRMPYEFSLDVKLRKPEGENGENAEGEPAGSSGAAAQPGAKS